MELKEFKERQEEILDNCDGSCKSDMALYQLREEFEAQKSASQKVKLKGQGRWNGSKFLTHEFDLLDVDYFELYHETGQNGSKLRAVLKEEVQDIKPKYGHGWDILGKDNKVRYKIMKQVQIKGKTITKGTDCGTYVATWNTVQLKAELVEVKTK